MEQNHTPRIEGLLGEVDSFGGVGGAGGHGIVSGMRQIGSITAVAVAALAFASAAAAQNTFVPSKARAVHDAKVEILHQYGQLLDTSRSPRLELMPKAWVQCHPLSDSLYRCAFMGQSFFYTVMGDAKVRVYKYASDVTLFNVKCYNGPRASLDYCNS